MTRLAVVSYPRMEEADRDWIEAIRARHDPQAHRIAAHFTLVFPVAASLAALSEEVAAIVEEHPPISFTVRAARAYPDVVAEGGHVFVVPDEGRMQITRLHHCLYEGLLTPHLRQDIPFVPHVTVAAYKDLHSCEALAEELTAAGRTITGVLDTVDVLELIPGAIVSRARLGLGGESVPSLSPEP
jgi:2'-5' RNA ligase